MPGLPFASTVPSGTATAPPPSIPLSKPAAVSPFGLSADGVHRLALEAFRIGNRGRLSLCEALRVLGETRLHLELGFPSVAAYADRFFQLRRAETFECVRVARALLELTELREAFGQGRIGWSVLKAVTRVASPASQSAWIDFAREHDVARTLAEARDALRRGRDKPRDSSFGLPNLDQKLVLRFSRSDLEKVRTWIEGACATVAARTGVEEVTLEQALLFLCEAGAVTAAGADRGSDSRHDAEYDHRPTETRNPAAHRAQIVYQRCPDCRRARLGTRDGFVEVDAGEVERYTGSAEAVVIDGPTPPALRRQVLAREGARCGNPRCYHRADHCHHIVFRSHGGPTELANEVGVCRTCHALIHAGLLRVRADTHGELHWSAALTEGSPRRRVAADGAVADRLPVLHLVSDGPVRSAIVPVGAVGGPSESADADSEAASGHGLDLESLAHGLQRLGQPLARSREIIAAAARALPRGELTEAAVLRRALAMT
ncbi:MAG TPA: HNH endonuclease signature motif containing protein [Candidatus Polarisedimenticolaceae bacterium]|nr:HNH endonuclease signature motif containing protein [Candidatus Polarisedimenticolaceae bacterium]